MTTLYRHRTRFTGFPGGDGIATMYFLNTDTAIASLHTLWSTLSDCQPSDVTVLIEPGGDTIEDTTGELVGAWAGDAVEAIVGGVSEGYAPASGEQVVWTTSTILDGRRLKGRTFVVPIIKSQYEGDGRLTVAMTSGHAAAAAEFVIEQGESFVIWHRPRAAVAAVGSRPARAAHAGGHGLVTGSSVPRKSVVLRSRRD